MTQAAEITSAAGADPAAESALLEAAAGTSVKGLKDYCREVRAGAEADDRAWARRLHVERQAYKWCDLDGAYCLNSRMAPDAGGRFDPAWEAHIDRIFRDARRAGRHVPRAAYAADALVALATEGPCKPVEVRVTVDSAAWRAGYPTCGVPGCANDQFLEIDDVVPLEDHGRTELDNLWRLCSHHHRLKTYGGWIVTGQNGDRDLVPPDDPDPP